LISFQIYLVPPQYHIGKASKSSRHFATIFIGCYDVITGLLFTLGTQTQVEARPKKIENTKEMPKDVLLLGHHLRRPARTSKPSRRPSPIRVRVCFGLLDQSAIKRTLRMHPDSVFDDPHMDGKIIS
jgi:hypothetical protein